MSAYDENKNEWFTKDRSETAINRVSTREVGQGITAENLGLGLNIYRNAFSLDDANRYIILLSQT